ncbi:hypothetical protein [Bradyrhizobium diazoefficiens]|nr:hypothetical protein [Bradyrhizobium diazoefficiens]WLC15668.1 hypothetical protein QIH76_37035 [Bradyrhizobium diazoefficiens]
MTVDLDSHRLARSSRMDRYFLDNLADAGERGLTRLIPRARQPLLE